jgi:hypothetical protein
MRERWRLPACVGVVLLGHSGMMAAWLHASASGVPQASPHRVAPVRMVVLESAPAAAAAAPESRPRDATAGRAVTEVPQAAASSSEPASRSRPSAGRAALAPEPADSAPPSPQEPTVAPVRDFLSPAEVDHIAIAFPSPDISSLSGLSWSGMPLRLRLFVALDGHCVDVQVLRASEDSATLARLRQMFLATHFLPARRAGADVDSYRDIELDVSDVK